MFKINFIFYLLFFSFACSSSQLNKFEPKIPQSEQTQITDQKDQIVVKIQDDRKVFLNSKEIGTIENKTKLEQELKSLFEIRKTQNRKDATTVFLQASKNMKYEEVQKIIETLKSIGAEPIGLQIDEIAR